MVLEGRNGSPIHIQANDIGYTNTLSYSLSSTIIVEEVMAKLFTKSRYEK
jgi:hypothetical protein